MPYDLRQWPATVTAEVEDFPEAQAEVDEVLQELINEGPSPEGRDVKTLGHEKGGLWQLNFKFEKRQIRILYAPYGETIVLFRIHKKSSKAEQNEAYELAMKRKREYERERAEYERSRKSRRGRGAG